jgi:ankyrin repeat protein
MSYLTADYIDKFAEERKKSGAEPMVIRLVKRGAYDAVDGVCAFSKEVNSQDKEGWTALHWMIQQIGDKSVKIDDAFKSAFDAVRKLTDHTIQNKAGHTPLDIAFVGPEPTSHLKRLLPLHSKVGSAFLRRALFAAIENNDINLLRGLVVGSADFFNPALSYDRRVFPHVSPDVLNEEGESALSVAIRVGNIDVIDLLLQHGACPKSHGKPLPFHTACEIHDPSTFVEVLAALCTRGADLRIRNKAKESCLTVRHYLVCDC